MTWLTLLACSDPPPPREVPPPPVVAVAVEPMAPPPPRPPARDPVVAAVALEPGAGVADCTEPCGPLPWRPQASTERVEGDRKFVADLALDDDPATAWCGEGGTGEQLSIALAAPRDIRGLAVRAASGRPAWVRASLVTDRKDHLTLTFGPAGELSGRLDLPAVQFLQLEALELAGEGPACLAEVALLGSPPPSGSMVE